MSHMGQHDLIQFFDQMSGQLSAEYARIWEHTREDPGTAGDEGEENWAIFLRDVLPEGFKVVTKGRILSASGVRTPQVDVLVLSPEYPQFMVRRQVKTYLADGVVAAFECKTTLRPQHLREAASTAADLRATTAARSGDPYRELFGMPLYGVLAHSHAWKEPRSEPLTNAERALRDGMQQAAHPRDLLDVVCVADLATWWAFKVPWIGPPVNGINHRVQVQLNRHDSLGSPLMALATVLLRRIAWEQPSLRPIARYFETVQPTTGGGPTRAWSMDILPEALRNQVMASRNGSQRPWDPWAAVLM
jgi:hypothetical protein